MDEASMIVEGTLAGRLDSEVVDFAEDPDES